MQKQSNSSEKITDTQLSRRDFLKLGLGAMSALALLEVGGASLLFMKPRSLEGEFGGTVNAGAVDSFPAGSVVEFPGGRFFLVRSHDGGFLAVYQRCTHLGCSVTWEPDQNRFFCPCHASSFDIHGSVENPPAPRALDTFPVTIADGQISVNTGQIQQRDSFSSQQLVYA
ncbi:MAG: ubiquinol-cytochrome c reductase iron-sulfur subunit [Candidatus Promineifilaceae bacterium]|jgi:cytochrome b6-f complex iron-sulfur subunit